MRRLLTTLVILLVVIIAGMTSLVFLINPNDFRQYMVERVEVKSGYQLAINGSLRWHVWPQLSIIAGQTSLTAPGAKAPVVSAENMRLDVKLWPLISHQLAVKQVLLKNAVIRLTPETEENQPNAPVAPSTPTPVAPGASELEAGWKFDIDKISVADSLLIWQRGDDEQINVRDINLEMEKNDNRQASIQLSSRINRDQRDLSFTMKADLDMQHYPQAVSASISKFTYQLNGADIPVKGLQGNGSMQVSYQRDNNMLTLNQLALSANDNQISGTASAKLGELADYQLNLTADKLDLDALSGWQPDTQEQSSQTAQSVTSAPVIARDVDEQPNGLNDLQTFNATLALKVADLTYRGMKIQNLALNAVNHQGQVSLPAFSGNLGTGRFSLPGTLDVTGNKIQVHLTPDVDSIELGDLLTAYGLPKVLTGSFSMQGNVNGEGLSAVDFARRWQGEGQLSMDNARLNGLNIQQLIQQAVSRNTSNVQGLEKYEHYSQIDTLKAQGHLAEGTLTLNNLEGQSPMVSAKGDGTIDMSNQKVDMNLLIRVTGGWKGDNNLINTLKTTDIPLRVYGPWAQMGYQLQVDQILRRTFEQSARSALQNWVDKRKDSKEKSDVEKLLNK
ncbi:AsmA family protein [Rahnella aceris]|jgi:AsmA protein|uniref:AsmA family protein n=1 Tax=Rahnella sp. (strain Y9602) TaxID=2703885 RepID=A0A0H3F8X6_RAHSY|nr:MULTISPECIES: outer membrane assembly protein AsmA [Rahnella]ADW73364.1 AsmA family protein [Rahnella aceris]MBU9841671.1 outer membrane assembly protein AsmA [Rahnella aceris]MQB53938.1 outer membrane assembly protein AsmA [Rahnella sp. RcJ3]